MGGFADFDDVFDHGPALSEHVHDVQHVDCREPAVLVGLVTDAGAR
jgi:hypothetical protein